jgi:hypothetical protein
MSASLPRTSLFLKPFIFSLLWHARWKLLNSWTRHTSLAVRCICLFTATGLAHAQPPGPLAVGRFSEATPGEKPPDGWQPMTFSRIERHTDYSLVKADGGIVVKAVSEQAASGLTRAVAIDPREYPFIQWRWKVRNLLQKGDVTRKDGDDYPARIYISFAFDPDRAGYLERAKHAAARLVYGEDVPYRAISYVWGSNSPAGTVVANTYTDRVMMFVVRDRDDTLQQWVTEKRNLFADYTRAFGEDPTTVSGVAIMTDTDNTRESAVAWYGDIVFLH